MASNHKRIILKKRRFRGIEKRVQNWKRCCHGITQYLKKVIDVEKVPLINYRKFKNFCDRYCCEIQTFEY